jgi:hypothetical protein
MLEILILGSFISWGVNTLLTPEPPPPRPVCHYIEPYGEGQLSTPVWCDEYGK